MKKKLALLMAPFLLLLSLAVPAFAEERYVPELPPFYSGGKITAPYDKEVNLTSSTFFKDFDARPHVTLLSQDTSTGYVNGVDISPDRLWKVTFVKLPASAPGTSWGEFSYYDPVHYQSYEPNPMQVISVGGAYFDTATYAYDYEKKTLNFLWCAKLNHTQFSYVLESSPLSNTASNYPGYRTLGGKNFDAYYFPRTGIDRHYDWWVGYKNGGVSPEEPDKPGEPDVDIDTDGDGKPDLNVDTDGDGKPDINIDTDSDGKPDLNVDTNGDRKPNLNVDTDGDGKPDINIDKNGNGKPDVNIDKDGDGKPDVNVDANGDDKPDINIDSNGDGKPDVNVDTDGDGKPDKNVQPDYDWQPGGGSGGDDWTWPDDDGDYPFVDFPIFNPFDFDNYTPPPSSGDPWNGYDPMEGYDSAPLMPDFPPCPTLPPYDYDPFKYPY